MEAFYMTLLLTLCTTLSYALYVSPDYRTAQEVDDRDSYFLKDSPPIKTNHGDDDTDTSWLEQVLRPLKDNADLSAKKRYSPQASRLSYPGLDSEMHKRNNGVWIWMPAQGYVSVPKDQQVGENESQVKHGKIMRYGRRK